MINHKIILGQNLEYKYNKKMKYLLLLIILLFPIVIVYVFRNVIDRNREPLQAIIFAVFFSFILYLVNYFLVKPSFGKILGYSDIYLFVYFLTEEYEHLNTLSTSQFLLVFALSALSKAIVLSIGLKLLYKYLYLLGKSKFFARNYASPHGFLDEPFDYAFYSMILVSSLAFFENIIRFRFGTDWEIVIFNYLINLILGLLLGSLWISVKVRFKSISGFFLINAITTLLRPSLKFTFFGLVTRIEISSIVLTFILLFVTKFIIFFSSYSFGIYIGLCTYGLFTVFLIQQIILINSREYEII